MAITLTDIAGTPNSADQKIFMIGSEADIPNLPTSTKEGVGIKGFAAAKSTAITNDGRIFVLGNDNVWREW